MDVNFLNRKLTEHVEAEHYTIGTEGAEIPHPHRCVIFDDLEGTVLPVDFSSLPREAKKKKRSNF